MLLFDIREALKHVRQRFIDAAKCIDGASISLPGITFNVKPNTVQCDTAKEIVIFLSDRRVLSSAQCCDDCVDKALASLQEIRAFLVQKQLAMKNDTDSMLYLLIELMLTEIRQFQTYVQKLEHQTENGFDDAGRLRLLTTAYIDSLQTLRGELLGLLSQIANIARMTLPTDRMLSNYPNIVLTDCNGYEVTWQRELYMSD